MPVRAEAEERELLEHLRAVTFSEIRMRGQVARRRTAHLGWLYGYGLLGYCVHTA